jgi:hypothetical protein
MLGVLSDERTVLSFAIATGPRQRSHSRVRVPWDSRPYFTVSDSRLPFSSPPMTRRAGGGIRSRLHTGYYCNCRRQLAIWLWVGLNRKHSFQQSLYCCIFILCHGKLFTASSPSNGCFSSVIMSQSHHRPILSRLN